MKNIKNIVLALSLAISITASAQKSTVQIGYQAYTAGDYYKAAKLLEEGIRNGNDLKSNDLSKALYFKGMAFKKLATTSSLPETDDEAAFKAFAAFKAASEYDDEYGVIAKGEFETLSRPLNDKAYGCLTEIYTVNPSVKTKSKLMQQCVENLKAAEYCYPRNYYTQDLFSQYYLLAEDSVSTIKHARLAIEYYTSLKGLKPDPSVALTAYRLAICERYYNHNNNEALKTIEQATLILKRDMERLKNFNYSKNELDIANKTAQRAEEELLNLKLDIYQHDKTLRDEAVMIFKEVIESHPENYNYLIAFAKVLEEKEPHQAMAIYERAIKLDSTKTEAPYSAGVICYNQALKFLKMQSESLSKEEGTLLEEEATNQMERAHHYFSLALNSDPDNSEIISILKQTSIFLNKMDDYNRLEKRLN